MKQGRFQSDVFTQLPHHALRWLFAERGGGEESDRVCQDCKAQEIAIEDDEDDDTDRSHPEILETKRVSLSLSYTPMSSSSRALPALVPPEPIDFSPLNLYPLDLISLCFTRPEPDAARRFTQEGLLTPAEIQSIENGFNTFGKCMFVRFPLLSSPVLSTPGFLQKPVRSPVVLGNRHRRPPVMDDILASRGRRGCVDKEKTRRGSRVWRACFWVDRFKGGVRARRFGWWR